MGAFVFAKKSPDQKENTHMKRLFALALVLTLLLSLCACGMKKENLSKENGQTGYTIKAEDSVALGMPATTLDPQSIYSKLTYTAPMFYGNYRLLGGDKAKEAFGKETPLMNWKQEYSEQLTKVPYQIEAGPHNLNHVVYEIEGYEWMRMHFLNENQGLCTVMGAYTVEGNTLVFTPLDVWEYDKQTKTANYTFSQTSMEFGFSFNGRNLTLSQDGTQITLTTGLTVYEDTAYYNVEHYYSQGTEPLDGIDTLDLHYSQDSGTRHIFIGSVDKERVHTAIAQIKDNGLLTLTVPWEAGTKTYQYVYFYGYRDGIVLTDGTNTYYYNDDYMDRGKQVLTEFVEEEQVEQLEELTENQMETIVEKKENLLQDLAAAYKTAGLNVVINEATGEIALDSTILFAVNESEISDAGKEFLQKFIGVYTGVVFSDKYQNFISRIMVEGHTDTSGSYELNQTLSQARADSVKAYCLSDECGVDTAMLQTLTDTLQAIGYAYDRPVYGADGQVDMDASRRVSFRFIINLGTQN